ncbi:hypothetical protein ACFZAU_03580 [Streptomyces sp. NPDC008238]
MSRGPVHAGDVVRAAAALGIHDPAGVLSLVRAMGLPGPAPRPPEPDGPAAPPRPDPGPPPRVPPAGRTSPRDEAVVAEPPAGAPAGTATAGRSLITFAPRETPPPAGQTDGGPTGPETPLFADREEVTERPLAPPWNPRTQQAIMLTVAATEALGRELDHHRLIDLLVRRLGGRLPPGGLRLPYRRRPTTRAGLHVLLDRSPSMRPFRHDHQWVARLARQVLAPDQLRVLDFRLPQGAGTGGGSAWDPAVRPAPGTPVLLVSDLGHLRPPVATRHQASPADWLAFLRRLRHAGHPVTCLTPFSPDVYPPAVRRMVALVPLDRRTSVWSARSQIRRLRRRGPAW